MEEHERLISKYGKSMMSVPEVAGELGVDEEDVQEIIASGELNIKKIGKKVVIPIVALAQYSNGIIIPANPVVDRTVPVPVPVPVPVVENRNLRVSGESKDVPGGCVSYNKRTNRWLYQLDLGKSPEDGKRLRASASFKTEEEARKALEDRRNEIAQSAVEQTMVVDGKGDRNIWGNKSFEEYIGYYLSLGTTGCTSRTREGYFYSAKLVCNEIGGISLNSVTTDVISRCFKVLIEKYAQSTLKKINVVLKMAFKYALHKKYISENPMELVSTPKSSKNREKKYMAYSAEEVHEILTKAKNYPELKPILLCLSVTGMRPGELRALKWKNVDYQAKSIDITNAATKEFTKQAVGKKSVKKEIIGPTKSSAGERTVFISDEVIEAINDWRNYVDTNKYYKYARSSEYLFCDKNGSFRKDDELRTKFKRFLKKEGLDGRGFTLYRFRHTVCTNLIKQGVDIPTIQRIMGDNTTDVILKIYSHINKDDIKKASQKLFNSYTGALNG